MKRFKNLLTILALFAFVAISGSAFAEDVNWDVQPSAKALAAASSYSYDQAYLEAVTSDAGADIIPSAKALAAAEFYSYDDAKLAESISDSGDNQYFASEHQSADVNAIVNSAESDSLICSSC